VLLIALKIALIGFRIGSSGCSFWYYGFWL